MRISIFFNHYIFSLEPSYLPPIFEEERFYRTSEKKKGWPQTGKTADLRSLAQVHIIFFNAANYLPWARRLFRILQNII
jgi:hypothetical protein